MRRPTETTPIEEAPPIASETCAGSSDRPGMRPGNGPWWVVEKRGTAALDLAFHVRSSSTSRHALTASDAIAVNVCPEGEVA
jgi:hypothetical protein